MTVLDADTLTAAEQVALIEGPELHVDAGVDLLDSHDVFITEFSGTADDPGQPPDFIAQGSSVERGIYRTVHGTATLNVSRNLDWGSQRLRPFLLLSNDGVTWYRRNLGVFLMSTPERVVSGDVPMWTVQCFDKLDVLNVPYLDTYSLPAGSNIVDAMIELIEDTGETKVAIEPSDKTNPNTRVMSVMDDWTRLGIINELAGMIGYRAVHVDRDGFYRSEQYRTPADLPAVFTYSANSPTTSVSEVRMMTADFYRAANVVKGVRESVGDTDIPVPGNGIYQAENPADGPTSIAARGRIIPAPLLRGEFADHASLVIAVDARLESEKRVANHVSIEVSPTFVHGHFDVVHYRDDDMTPAVNGRYLVTDWTVPLDGSNVSLHMRAV